MPAICAGLLSKIFAYPVYHQIFHTTTVPIYCQIFHTAAVCSQIFRTSQVPVYCQIFCLPVLLSNFPYRTSAGLLSKFFGHPRLLSNASQDQRAVICYCHCIFKMAGKFSVRCNNCPVVIKYLYITGTCI